MIELILLEKGAINVNGTEKSPYFYKGRPVMVKQNDYNLKLYNGDIGIAWEESPGNLRVYFPNETSGFKSYTPARLPEHETAYAMTIHKSQGSEFNHILMILPDTSSPMYTRELIYTGITRAKKSAELWATSTTLKFSTEHCVARKSGLQDALLDNTINNQNEVKIKGSEIIRPV
jgi:exodeoxyribonuclease V alpha subunit